MANQFTGKAASEILALKPYRGKPAVRNFRGGNGNVGIIRSPVHAIALPDRTLSEGAGWGEQLAASNALAQTASTAAKRPRRVLFCFILLCYRGPIKQALTTPGAGSPGSWKGGLANVLLLQGTSTPPGWEAKDLTSNDPLKPYKTVPPLGR